MNLEKALKDYADVAIKFGINLKKGKTLIINSPIHANDMVEAVVESAYKAGALKVYVRYYNADLNNIEIMHGPAEALETGLAWEYDGLLAELKEGASYLHILSDDPMQYSGVDPEKVRKRILFNQDLSKEFRAELMNGNAKWAIISYPNIKWAKKVFPEKSDKEAFDSLMKEILTASRILVDDPVAEWEKHLSLLTDRLTKLNEMKLSKLIYKSATVDLEIGLPKGHIWIGGGQTARNGEFFLPNIPTEEIFTLPSKYEVNGRIRSSKPLSKNGVFADDFTFIFKDGKIVEYSAETGEDELPTIIDADENARYLGEVALVPHSSPISQSGIIFYNTLFDENASCHLAVGDAYKLCLEGSEGKTAEELEKMGANTSKTHVDFMIGTEDLDILGITEDGKEIRIFENGNFVI